MPSITFDTSINSIMAHFLLMYHSITLDTMNSSSQVSMYHSYYCEPWFTGITGDTWESIKFTHGVSILTLGMILDTPWCVKSDTWHDSCTPVGSPLSAQIKNSNLYHSHPHYPT